MNKTLIFKYALLRMIIRERPWPFKTAPSLLLVDASTPQSNKSGYVTPLLRQLENNLTAQQLTKPLQPC